MNPLKLLWGAGKILKNVVLPSAAPADGAPKPRCPRPFTILCWYVVFELVAFPVIRTYWPDAVLPPPLIEKIWPIIAAFDFSF